MEFKKEDRIIAYIESRGFDGATCDEVEVALDMRHQTASAIISVEYRNTGVIIASRRRRKTRSGRGATVWVVGPQNLTPVDDRQSYVPCNQC